MPTLLVTRAEPDASALAATLRARGVDAVAAPCLAFIDLPGEPAAVRARRGLPTDVLVASPRAATVLLRQGIDPAWRVLALAPRTAALLPGAVPVAGGGVALAAAAGPGAVVALRSDVGGEEIRAARPDAIDWPAYRTVCPTDLPDAARRALDGPFEVLLMSPSAVDHLQRLAPGALARASRVWWHGGTTRAALAARGVTGERWVLNTG